MNLFYAPDISGGLCTLNEEESRHCLKVLRLSAGDIIHVTDGKGNIYEAKIIDDKGKHCTVQVLGASPHINHRQSTIDNRQFSYGYRQYRLHIAIAPTKNIDRFEWFLEKATEIGIDEITPLICEHSERRQLRIDRLEKIITAAMKQSLKAFHPVLHQPASFSQFISTGHSGEKFIAYITDNTKSLSQLYHGGQDAVILIGPEGDFSPAEVALARQSGYQVVSLGNSRLRTETAGIVACHTVSVLNLE